MPSDLDQHQLLENLRKGGRAREKAVSILYEHLFPKLMVHMLYQGCPRHKAEDLIQDTFIKVIQNIDQFRGDSSLTTWIRKILNNTWVDHLRGAYEVKREEIEAADLEQIEDEQNPLAPQCLASAEIVECVRSGYKSFREKHPDQATWLYKLVEGASIAELAEEAGRNLGAMREYLSQCRKKLAPFIAHCLSLVQA